MEKIPKVKSVSPLGKEKLLVTFDVGVRKIYDCRFLFSKPPFQLLATPAFFNAVRVDPGGYGISWNDDMDISEYELWINGKIVPDNSDVETGVENNRIIICSVKHVRNGPNKAFKMMRQKDDDEPLIDEKDFAHSWDEEEWRW
jgi:hypothetical protein